MAFWLTARFVKVDGFASVGEVVVGSWATVGYTVDEVGATDDICTMDIDVDGTWAAAGPGGWALKLISARWGYGRKLQQRRPDWRLKSTR